MNLVKYGMFFSIPSVLSQGPVIDSLLNTANGMCAQDIMIGKIAGESFKFFDHGSCNETITGALEGAIENIFICPESKQLWNEVESKLFFTVSCGTAEGRVTEEGAGVYFKAYRGKRDFSKGEIKFSKTVKHPTALLLFEVSNLKRPWLNNICDWNVEDYAIKTETIEYQSVKEAQRISESCFKAGFWSKDFLKEYESTNNQHIEGLSDNAWKTSSLEDYLETQDLMGHTDQYRTHWYEECDFLSLSNWRLEMKSKEERKLLMAHLKDFGKLYEELYPKFEPNQKLKADKILNNLIKDLGEEVVRKFVKFP